MQTRKKKTCLQGSIQIKDLLVIWSGLVFPLGREIGSISIWLNWVSPHGEQPWTSSGKIGPVQIMSRDEDKIS